MGLAQSFSLSPLPEAQSIIRNNSIYLSSEYLQYQLQDILDLTAKAISLLRFEPNFKVIQPGSQTNITLYCIHPFSGEILISYKDAILALVKMYTNGALIALSGTKKQQTKHGQNNADLVTFSFYENFNQFYYYGAKIAEEVQHSDLPGVILGLVQKFKDSYFIPFHFDSRVLSWEQIFELFKQLPSIANEIGNGYNLICSRYVQQYNYFILFCYKMKEIFTLKDLAEGDLLDIMSFIIQQSENSGDQLVDLDDKFRVFPSSLQFLEAFCNDFLLQQNKKYLIRLKDVEVIDMRIQKLNIIKIERSSTEGLKSESYVRELVKFFQEQNKLANNAEKLIIDEIQPPTFDYQKQKQTHDVENSDDLGFDEVDLLEQAQVNKSHKPRKLKKFKYDISMTSLDLPLNIQPHQKQSVNEQLSNLLPNQKDDFKQSLNQLPLIKGKQSHKMSYQPVLVSELNEFVQGVVSGLVEGQDCEICYLDNDKYPQIQKFVNKNSSGLSQSQILANLNNISSELIKITSRNCYVDEKNGVLRIGS